MTLEGAIYILAPETTSEALSGYDRKKCMEMFDEARQVAVKELRERDELLKDYEKTVNAGFQALAEQKTGQRMPLSEPTEEDSDG